MVIALKIDYFGILKDNGIVGMSFQVYTLYYVGFSYIIKLYIYTLLMLFILFFLPNQ